MVIGAKGEAKKGGRKEQRVAKGVEVSKCVVLGLVSAEKERGEEGAGKVTGR